MNLILLTDMNLSWMYSLGLLISLVVPFLLMLLIARFRGLIASIFSVPFILGLIAFALSFGQVTKMLTDMGTIGLGLLEGLNQLTTLFLLGHNQLIESIIHFVPNETFASVLRASWFMFVPYLLFFIIAFAIFHKRKKKAKEDDYF